MTFRLSPAFILVVFLVVGLLTDTTNGRVVARASTVRGLRGEKRFQSMTHRRSLKKDNGKDEYVVSEDTKEGKGKGGDDDDAMKESAEEEEKDEEEKEEKEETDEEEKEEKEEKEVEDYEEEEEDVDDYAIADSADDKEATGKGGSSKTKKGMSGKNGGMSGKKISKGKTSSKGSGKGAKGKASAPKAKKSASDKGQMKMMMLSKKKGSKNSLYVSGDDKDDKKGSKKEVSGDYEYDEDYDDEEDDEVESDNIEEEVVETDDTTSDLMEDDEAEIEMEASTGAPEEEEPFEEMGPPPTDEAGPLYYPAAAIADACEDYEPNPDVEFSRCEAVCEAGACCFAANEESETDDACAVCENYVPCAVLYDIERK